MSKERIVRTGRKCSRARHLITSSRCCLWEQTQTTQLTTHRDTYSHAIELRPPAQVVRGHTQCSGIVSGVCVCLSRTTRLMCVWLIDDRFWICLFVCLSYLVRLLFDRRRCFWQAPPPPPKLMIVFNVDYISAGVTIFGLSWSSCFLFLLWQRWHFRASETCGLCCETIQLHQSICKWIDSFHDIVVSIALIRDHDGHLRGLEN